MISRIDPKTRQALQAAFAVPPPSRKAEFLRSLPPLPPPAGGPLWLVRVQLRYIRKRVWLAGTAVAALCLGAGALPGWNADRAWTLSALLPLGLLAAAAELGRSAPCGMAELEQACRYDLRQLVLARAWLLGLGQLPVLAAALAAAGPVWGAAAALYLLAPYLLAAWLCLWALGVCRGPEAPFACAAACVGVAVLRTALEQAPLALYAPRALWGWGAAVLLGAGLMPRQARRWLAAPGVG